MRPFLGRTCRSDVVSALIRTRTRPWALVQVVPGSCDRQASTTTGAARAAGHELFLEVPLEPFDYPDNDPGPQTTRAHEMLKAFIARQLKT